MLFDILALISLLIILLMLRRLVGVCPSLMACLIRWKESVNLETSAQLSRDRNLLAMTMVIPFSLTVWKYGLYCPGFILKSNDNIGLCITIGAVFTFILVRKGLELMLRPRKRNSKTYDTACKAGRTFFSLLTLTLLAMGGIMSFNGTPDDSIKTAMLWVSAAIYMVFILRKFQIFVSSTSFFAGFLYLCALELIPTGAIIASAIIL